MKNNLINTNKETSFDEKIQNLVNEVLNESFDNTDDKEEIENQEIINTSINYNVNKVNIKVNNNNNTNNMNNNNTENLYNSKSVKNVNNNNYTNNVFRNSNYNNSNTSLQNNINNKNKNNNNNNNTNKRMFNSPQANRFKHNNNDAFNIIQLNNCNTNNTNNNNTNNFKSQNMNLNNTNVGNNINYNNNNFNYGLNNFNINNVNTNNNNFNHNYNKNNHNNININNMNINNNIFNNPMFFNPNIKPTQPYSPIKQHYPNYNNNNNNNNNQMYNINPINNVNLNINNFNNNVNPNIINPNNNNVNNNRINYNNINNNNNTNNNNFFNLSPQKNIPSSFSLGASLNTSPIKLKTTNPNQVSLNEISEVENLLSEKDKIDEEIHLKIKNKIMHIITKQNGSRILQKYLIKTEYTILTNILEELHFSLPDLMIDPYGNYFCQKFFSCLNDQDRMKFLLKIIDNFHKIAVHKIGTYPLQVLIELLKYDLEKQYVIDCLNKLYLSLIKDQYGCHVIEKIVSCFKKEEIDFIYDNVLANFLNYSNHSNALCVCKKVVSDAEANNDVKKISSLLIENSNSLIQNPYGNYTLQTAFDNWSIENIQPIIDHLVGKFCSYSMHKYSSNVVEKFLIRNPLKYVNLYYEECINSGKISEVMKNNFGNYVVQKCLKLTCNNNIPESHKEKYDELKNKLIDLVESNIEKIGDKKLILKWKKIISEYSNIYNL